MPSTARKKQSARARSSAAQHSSAIDKQLAKYRSMRDFKITAEPKGGSHPSGKKAAKISGMPFVIQKHAATRLHYDFRLGWHGVLKSWAVTKGPSYYPGDKRLAVQVEDHPMEYGGFEGIIPKGQYGGGTVMLWDEGTWEPQGDANEGFASGRLKFILHGKKLHGKWTLIRMSGKAAGEKKSNWLLIKEHDQYERGPSDPCVTEEEPDSVITERSMEEIAQNQDHVWGSNRDDRSTETPKKQSSSKKKASEPLNTSQKIPATASSPSFGSMLRDAPKEALPEFISPQLAIQVSEAPEGAEWVHELKLDGYRIQARIRRAKNSTVALITRGGLDWTHRMKDIAHALSKLPVEDALLDGEVVVFDEHGGTNFASLQAAFQEGKKQHLTYVIFDLLHLNGRNLRNFPLERRKQILQKLLSTVDDPDTIRFGEHLRMDGRQIFENACKLGAEGIVSKKISSLYVSSRNGAWLKIKCIRQQEFVIGGFTPPEKSNVGFGALMLGYYRDGDLIYAGRTGTGFTQQFRKQMRARLEKMKQDRPPFVSLPSGAGNKAIWVEPKLVCEVRFATWTADNLVRQASFQGLREDKSPREVKRELPVEKADESKTMTPKKSERKSNARMRTSPEAGSLASKKNPGTKRTSGDGEPFPIALTHPDKQVDSETKLTKRELADYFWAVRDHMMPFISDRPLSVVRCPQGSTQPCFYQKHVAGNLPEGIGGIDIRGRRSGVVETYITISTPLGLAGLAQMGVLEIHPWGSTNRDIEKPDMLIFDLDPDESIPWKTLAESAREVQTRLKQCKLEAFLKTTGGKGLHIVAPIEPEYDWPVIKEVARGIAAQMESENPKLYLTKMTKAARKGKIYVDYLRNDRGATSIAPFSPRARHGAPVAATLDWKELDASRVPRFLVADFDEWKERLRRDPWTKMAEKRKPVSPAILERFTSGPAAASGSRRLARRG